jgi:hypothetical protein
MEKLEQLKEIVNKYSKELEFFVKENNGIDSSQASTFGVYTKYTLTKF